MVAGCGAGPIVGLSTSTSNAAILIAASAYTSSATSQKHLTRYPSQMAITLSPPCGRGVETGAARVEALSPQPSPERGEGAIPGAAAGAQAAVLI